MDIYDLIPLYQVFCISVILLVPVLPAWCLYKITPKDKFLAKGSFAGFQINATGAVAIFIVLFASIYANMDSINHSIVNLERYNTKIMALTAEVDSLKKKQPWKLQCQVKIVKRDIQGTVDSLGNNNEYYACLNPDSIQTLPMSINVIPGQRLVSFYVDDDVLKTYENSYSITLPGGYGSTRLKLSPTKADSADKSISVTAVIYKNSSDPNLRGNKGEVLKVYDTSQGINQLPMLSSH